MLKICIRVDEAALSLPVHFSILIPSPEKTSLIYLNSHKADQPDFVNFLRDGILHGTTDYRPYKH
ncbi:MAG: hypothetical protein COZ46_01130 [Verrucomicrobia bacterium CG_4_10_14_3_um_filter_43_23]|nr:MAG: hypothetical protein AUJ82_01165 [Verrucomicrobia bacterium CG1_02_43_26]PIP59508.1 MAG: hypothetical protein COX01_02735 [Verrucomicrobia bacterium CG22_combo_CG10-13_8_21_14_all_43_17]PIX58809.1 MAG: hypothetical protein COZ46_01130 [Verrucomicrobia bacterium CG_4_10_14_3_um_filter_43_23]PIY60905.1 MAG: hypothetical protein COY94_07810 [Verrucomicrobia bacterium CG_4_10_14_0_8_um_filter_43_34]PJA44601.1 MAG: hypothetical protein CO175_01980 [Verrucomicrobia bacterium CG_4_9_14_3_um_fi